MNKYVLLASALACYSMLFAEEKSPLELSITTSGAYYPKVDHKSGSSHFSGVSGVYESAELVTEFDAVYTLPFMQGEDDLTKDNYAAFKLGLELSPVTIAPVASATISPIAFLELAIGGTVGTGWNISDIFQGMAKYNESKPEYKDMTPFAHWYLYGWASACLMFDFAEIWEGDWHHIVATATYKAGYQKLTGTNADVWLWQATEGLASGWIYEQEYVLGYQMPLKVSMIAIGTTLSGHYKSSDFGKYASSYKGDFMTIDIWPSAEITLGAKDKLYVLADFQSRRSFHEKYDNTEHEPLMTYSGREWIFYSLAVQWKHVF
jgi:hypothetical protein